MTRVAVIGNSGGGKTTLCARLGQALDLPVHVVDLFQFQPGWVQTPEAEFNALHQEWLASDRWIIDGWGSWASIAERFDAADTIIFVDFPLWVHYWWSIKRQVKCIVRPRADVPPDCPMLPMTWRLMKIIRKVHVVHRPRVIALLEARRAGKRIVWLRSPRELREFSRAYADRTVI